MIEAYGFVAKVDEIVAELELPAKPATLFEVERLLGGSKLHARVKVCYTLAAPLGSKVFATAFDPSVDTWVETVIDAFRPWATDLKASIESVKDLPQGSQLRQASKRL